MKDAVTSILTAQYREIYESELTDYFDSNAHITTSFPNAIWIAKHSIERQKLLPSGALTTFQQQTNPSQINCYSKENSAKTSFKILANSVFSFRF